MNPSDTKNNIRLKYKKIRSQITPETRQQAEKNITNKILELAKHQEVQKIATYISIKDEVDTSNLITKLQEYSKQIYVPVIQQETISLKLFTSISDCVPGKMNIPEPPSNSPQIKANEIDLWIIPCLACDVSKNRLGYGKGYYDQLLKNSSGFKVGICFTDQLTSKLPVSAHDIPMDIVITDTISLL